MDSGRHRESGLAKSVWSEADFEEMGWHDATVHGISVQATGDLFRLLLDLDYIVRWVEPAPPATHFSFWVSPATLVFEEARDLEGDLDFTGPFTDLGIADVHRLVPDDGRQELPLWHIEGRAFDVKFRATGFRQYIRRVPELVPGQALPHAQRGGGSFAEVAFAGPCERRPPAGA